MRTLQKTLLLLLVCLGLPACTHLPTEKLTGCPHAATTRGWVFTARCVESAPLKHPGNPATDPLEKNKFTPESAKSGY
jgi:hypothetical protein